MMIEVIKEIEKANKILLISHRDPDGDALGSLLGFMHLLLNQGKEVLVYSSEPISTDYDFLPGYKKIKNVLPVFSWPDLVIILDCHESERVGEIANSFLSHVKRIVIIDHHLGESSFGQVFWIDSKYAATCEMLCLLAQNNNWVINTEAATCLFVGLQTDTGRFCYSNTVARTLRLGADLLELGAQPWTITQKGYCNTLAQLKLIGHLFLKAKALIAGKVILVQIPENDLLQLKEIIDGSNRLIDDLLCIKNVELAVLLKEQNEGWIRVSFRSRGKIDVGSLAIKLGGGGHSNAAGVRLKMSLAEAEFYLSQILLEKLGIIK